MFQSGFSAMGPGGYGFASHLHPSAGYISAMHSPHAPMSMGYGTNPGVVPPTAAPSPAPSPSASSFMPVPPVPTMPTMSSMPSVIQQSGKQRRSSSTHRYTPIAPAPSTHPTNTTAPSPVVTSSTPSVGYYNQHSSSTPTQPQVPIVRPASQYLPPVPSPSHPVPSSSTSSTTATAPSCSLAKLQQLTNGLAESASPHHTMTPPPNQTPPPLPPSHLHGLSHSHYGHGVVPTPPPSAISSQQSYAKYYQGSVPSPIPVSPSPVAGLNTTSNVLHSSNNELSSSHSGGHNPSLAPSQPGRPPSSTTAASSPSSSTGRNSNSNNNSSSSSNSSSSNSQQRAPVSINSQQLMQYQLNGYRMSMAGMAGMPGMPGMPGMGMPSMSMMAAQHQALNSASYIAANPGFMNQSQLPMQMGVMNMHAHAAAAHAVQHGHPHAPPHGHSAAAAAAQAAQYQQDQRTGTPAGMYTTPYAYGIVPQLNGTMRR